MPRATLSGMQETFLSTMNSQVAVTFTDRVVCFPCVSSSVLHPLGGGKIHAVELNRFRFLMSDWPVFCVPQQPVSDHCDCCPDSVTRGNAGNGYTARTVSPGNAPGWCERVITGGGGIAGGLLRLKLCTTTVVCIKTAVGRACSERVHHTRTTRIDHRSPLQSIRYFRAELYTHG